MEPRGTRTTPTRRTKAVVVSLTVAATLAPACAGPDGRGRDDTRDISANSIAPMPISGLEYAERRNRLMAALPEGVVLLHARPSPKSDTEWGYVQDPSFYYFTGLSDVTGAILALDGPGSRALLFLPPPPESFGFPVPGLVPPARSGNRGGVRCG